MNQRNRPTGTSPATDSHHPVWTVPAHHRPQAQSRVTHTWVTSGGRALCVRVDSPLSGTARGSVVIVPPIGRETVVAFRSLRALAIAAARHGLVAYSFDLTGQANSGPSRGHLDLASAWRHDVAEVIASAQKRSPELPLTAVGLRLGATILSGLELKDIVTILWEPVSGTAYLRQQRRLRKVAVDQAVVPDGVELYGLHLTEEQALSVASLKAPKSLPSFDVAKTQRISIRQEVDRSVADSLYNISPHYARIPHTSIEEICAGLATGPEVPYECESVSAVVHQIGETSCTELHIPVGPLRLHGILTLPRTPPRAAVLFLSMGSETKSGPGDLWTRAARHLAQQGVASLRVDRQLTGEDTDPDATYEPAPYRNESVQDTQDALTVLRLHCQGPIYGVSVCSGGWYLLHCAPSAGFSGMLIVNMIHWEIDGSKLDDAFYRREFAKPAKFSIDSETNESGLSRIKQAGLERAKRRLLYTSPKLHDLLKGRSRSASVDPLLRKAPPGCEVRLVMGQRDAITFESRGGRDAVRNAYLRGVHLIIDHNPELDHSILSEGARRAVLRTLECLTSDVRTASPEMKGAQGETEAGKHPADSIALSNTSP